MTAAAYRLARESDLAFVYDNWLDSWRLAHAAGTVPMATYRDVYSDAIRRLLARPTCDVIVAYAPGEASGIVDLDGFICSEHTSRGPVIHYVCVRQSQRRQGIARGLVDAAGIDRAEFFTYTHRTPVIDRIRARGSLGFGDYDPLAARFDSAWAEDRKETA